MSDRIQRRRFSPAVGYAVCFAAYASTYISRVNLSMAGSELISQGFLNAAQIGTLGTVFSVTYACGRLVNSSLCDRIVPWIMICCGLTAAGLANVLSGILPAFIAMAFLWGLNAYGQSMLWGSMLRVIPRMFSPEKGSRRMAVFATSLVFGNIIGIIGNTYLIGRFGVRYAYYVPGTLNLLLAPAVFLSIRRVPFEGKPDGGRAFGEILLLKNPEMRRMILPSVCQGVMKDNISLWMAIYFVSFFGIDLQKSSYFVLLIPAIGLVGRLLFNMVYKLFRSDESAVSRAAFLLCGAAALMLILRRLHPVFAAICMALIYAASSLINTSLQSVFPLRFAETGETASASGILDFVAYLGSGVCSAIYGALIGRMGNAGYSVMFASWTALSAVCVLILSGFRKGRSAR